MQAAEALGDEIARLSAHIHAAQYRLLTLLREFDGMEGWGPGGFRSCAHWLSWRTGLSLGPAREKVRVAHALADLPLISERMERGQFSYSKVRALTRVATRENEAELIVFAEHGSVAQVEFLVRGWRRLDRQEAAAEEELRHASRSLSVRVDDDGMYVLRGRLDPEVGALLMAALAEKEAELFKADPESSGAQRRADALGEILRSGEGPSVQAVIHVTDDRAQTEEGVHVSAETSQRLTCDCEATEVRTGSRDVVSVGRRRRTVPKRMRRVLELRDGGRCRFPGCAVRHCDAHHVQHWAHGGETRLDNLVLLCRFHHRRVHEGGFGVHVAGGSGGTSGAIVRFWRPDGTEIPNCPEGEAVERPTLGRWHGQEGIGGETTTPRGWGGRVDYGWGLLGLRGEGSQSSPRLE